MFMKTKGLWMAVAVLAVMGIFGAAQAAALLEGKGSLSGTVLGADGKPAVGLALRLEFDTPAEAGTPGGVRSKGKISIGDSGARELQGKPNPRTKIIGRATADQSGHFLFSNIDEGTYRLVAGTRSQGMIYQDVEIKANEETKMGELKLIKVK